MAIGVPILKYFRVFIYLPYLLTKREVIKKCLAFDYSQIMPRYPSSCRPLQCLETTADSIPVMRTRLMMKDSLIYLLPWKQMSNQGI